MGFADLAGAEMYGARLEGAELPNDVLVVDPRGYTLVHRNGRYICGCRDFTAAEALSHWSNPDHENLTAAGVLYDAVAAHHDSISPTNKGW